jgi:hypothetical protein
VYSGTVSDCASKLTASSTGDGNNAGSAGLRSGSRSTPSRIFSPSITSRTVSVVPSTSNAIRPSGDPSFTSSLSFTNTYEGIDNHAVTGF